MSEMLISSRHSVANASLYTDFSGLAQLRAKAANPADEAAKAEAAKEVAKQFESLFLQMMLKSMRDANVAGKSEESDQTKFYQEMFDKQIALDLAHNGGIGLAKMLEKQITENQQASITQTPQAADLTLIRQQIERTGSAIQPSVLQPEANRQE